MFEKAVQPPELQEWLRDQGYLIDVDLALGHTDLEAFWRQLVTHHDARVRVLVGLLERDPCDLFFVAFTGTDRLHHFLWAQMERGEEPWASRFHEYYDRVDAAVGELVRRLPDDCRLILLSDHGFASFRKSVKTFGILFSDATRRSAIFAVQSAFVFVMSAVASSSLVDAAR